MTADSSRDGSADSARAGSADSARGDRGANLSLRERVFEALDRRLPYLLLLPALLLVAGVLLYPLLWAIKTSLYAVEITNLGGGTFVGLRHYVALVGDPAFARVLRNTLVFVVASVAGQFGLGLGLAVLLDRDWPGPRLTWLFRASYLLPWATTGVIVAYSWQFMFEPRVGLVNAALRWIGVGQPPTWLDSLGWAMVALIVTNVWRGVPFSLLFQTSGLQRIPDSLYEAAAVGGASRLQTLRHVTLQLLRPFVLMNLLLITLFTVNVFDIVFVMTGGGPLESTEVLALYMYETAFEVGAFGRASAIAVVLFALNLTIATGYLLVLERNRGVKQ